MRRLKIQERVRWSLEAFDRTGGENPFAIQHDLQDMMQDLVGIVRNEDEMQRALVASIGPRRLASWSDGQTIDDEATTAQRNIAMMWATYTPAPG